MTRRCVTRPRWRRATFPRAVLRPCTALQATGLAAPGARRPGLLALVLVTLLAAGPLFAASAGDLYTAALTQEHALRAVADAPATLEHLRDTIAAYEDIVLQYPRSGYSDNALWQAAGLAIEAFGRYRRPVTASEVSGFWR